MIELKNVSYGYSEAVQPVLPNFSFKLKAGELLGIIGSNGSGKSTILHTLSGVIEPLSGSVNKNLNVSYIPQDPRLTLLPWHSVQKNIRLMHQLPKTVDIEIVKEIMKKFMIPKELLNSRVFTLSGGQMQRLAWACSLRKGIDILLLDEPFSKQDKQAKRILVEHLINYKSKIQYIVLVDHDPIILTRCSDSIMTLSEIKGTSMKEKKIQNISLPDADRLSENSDLLIKLSEKVVTDAYGY